MCSRYHRHRAFNTTFNMSIDKTRAIIAAVWFAIGCLCGFFMGKGVYDKPVVETVTRDTVRITDTIPHYYPQPVDGTVVRYITKYLPVVKTDTCVKTNVITCHDTVAVEVLIESKHYQAPEYDAWVSGYEPSLDSIKVYKETQYITETITRTVKDNKHFFLDVGAGCEYQFNGKTAVPFAELGARLKFGRVGIGAYGGYAHDLKENKASPQARIKVSYDILGF